MSASHAPMTAQEAPRRAARLTVIDGGLSTWNRRQSSRVQFGPTDFRWTADFVHREAGEINFVPVPPPGPGWRIIDATHDRRTLWVRCLPCGRGRP